MRPLAGILLCSLLFGACTETAEEPPPDAIASVEPTVSIASPAVTPSPEVTLEPTETCDGLGKPPRRGEITFVSEVRLMAVSPDGTEERCLADLEKIWPVHHQLAWNAPGDRVIVGGHAFSRDLTGTRRLATDKSPEWSRPTGTSVVWISDEGRLMKRSSLGGKAVDISFLARHDDVTYHPAGTHIATSGLEENGDYGLFLATNVGAKPKLIAKGEKARFISDLTFAEDGRMLYYQARHGPERRGPENWHLHRMQIGAKASLETLAKQGLSFDYAVSPTDPFQIAWFSPGDCAAGEPGTFRTNYPKLQILDDLRDSDLRPVGWLSPGRLVVTSSPISCGTAAPRDVYVLRRAADPVLIAEEVGATSAVRLKMPKPPPPPGDEQAVVA